MANSINGKKVAILVADGVEQSELLSPRDALTQAGADVKVVSLHGGEIQGFNHLYPDQKIPVDLTVEEASPDKFDALMIPGGVHNPDRLRRDEKALDFVRAFFKAGKPVGAICHGPQVLITADLVRGRTMTGFSSIRIDLANAGANVVDQEVVTDKGLVTSRGPDDLPAFNDKLIEEIAEGYHAAQSRAAQA
jgi:protease I